jgi:hypothetical protein
MDLSKNIVFFRNDDVRATLDKALIDVTDLFIRYQIPIAHAVEPANVTPEVIEWVKDVKTGHPDIIELMQHGYDHTIKNKERKGEFGGQRGYQEQYDDIRKGKDLMNKHFGDLWFEAFNFPYAPYNPAAIKAVNDVGFKVLNSHFNSKFDRKVFYFFGHLLRKGFWLGHHVSWNLQKYPKTDLFEIDMNLGFIKKYLNEGTDSVMFTLEELKQKTIEYSKYRTIGVLLHHRYHNTQANLDLVEEYLKWIKTTGAEFLTMEKIYDRLGK